jgi:hypothetical protein
LRRALRLLFASLVLGACAASLLALWAADAWLADLAVHFRVQYLAIGLLAAPWLAWRRHWPLAAAAVATVALNVAPVVTAFSLPAAAVPTDTIAERPRRGRARHPPPRPTAPPCRCASPPPTCCSSTTPMRR